IRGYRVEPGEIETNLLQHTKISETAITLREDEEGEKYLCAYYVSTGKIETGQLRNFLLETLPDYMIPSHFTRLEKMPLTPGGKTDRNALPKPDVLHKQQYYTAPRNETEKKLTQIWAETLKIEKKEIGIDNDFFQMGGHSLRATVMVSKIHKQFDIKLPLAEIFKKTTIRTQGQTIKEYAPEKYEAIEPVEKKEYYNMSAAQKRLYILQQMEHESTAYNMPYTIPLANETEPVRLEKAFKKLIRRHESLRTSFHMINERLVQKLHPEVEFKIDNYNPQPGNQNSNAGFFRPFELSKAPLLRVGIVETTGKENANHNRKMILDMHHIITDGTSQEILTKELLAIYAGESLPPLKLQYKEYAQWQNRKKQTELKKQQEEYWLNRYPGELPLLNLPTDNPRPEIQRFEGNRISFALNKNETAKLKKMAKENEITLYMAILSIYTLLLSKLSGQEDIIVGTPTAGRRHADLENIIGMFVNTLAIRNTTKGGKTIEEYLREVKENTMQAFE
ncbi:MAG: non-ribosomal peptide synthetase, partial [bacterium]|nr:non-ribosomal peptide synthetase [bacterium]